MNSKRARDLGFYVLLIAIMIAVIFTMTQSSESKQLKEYSDLVDLFEKEKVQSFSTEGNTIILQVRTDSGEPPTEEMTYDLMSFNVFYNDFNETIKDQYARGVLEKYDYDFLEVCSPGIDRPLKTERDIQKSLGMLVEARLYKPIDGRKSAQGLLKEMNQEQVVLQCGEETLTFPRKAVSQVRLVPDLSALDEEE